MAENNVEKWSTLKEVQEHLGVGRETILHWISLRGMPAYKVGRLWKFKLSEVDDWFALVALQKRSKIKKKIESVFWYS